MYRVFFYDCATMLLVIIGDPARILLSCGCEANRLISKSVDMGCYKAHLSTGIHSKYKASRIKALESLSTFTIRINLLPIPSNKLCQ